MIVELKLIDFLLRDLFSLHIFSNCRLYEVSNLRGFFSFRRKTFERKSFVKKHKENKIYKQESSIKYFHDYSKELINPIYGYKTKSVICTKIYR